MHSCFQVRCNIIPGLETHAHNGKNYHVLDVDTATPILTKIRKSCIVTHRIPAKPPYSAEDVGAHFMGFNKLFLCTRVRTSSPARRGGAGSSSGSEALVSADMKRLLSHGIRAQPVQSPKQVPTEVSPSVFLMTPVRSAAPLRAGSFCRQFCVSFSWSLTGYRAAQQQLFTRWRGFAPSPWTGNV